MPKQTIKTQKNYVIKFTCLRDIYTKIHILKKNTNNAILSFAHVCVSFDQDISKYFFFFADDQVWTKNGFIPIDEAIFDKSPQKEQVLRSVLEETPNTIIRPLI